MDIESHKNNIIIYRIDENPQSTYVTQEGQRNTMDIEKVKKIIKTVTGSEGGETIAKCTRVGKATPEKKRPILESFKDSGDKDKFMDNLKNLEGIEFSNISVAHDLTPSQCQQLKKLRAEAKHKQESESGDWVYRVVGHPSRWTVRKLKRRTQPQTDQPEPNTNKEPPETLPE